MPRPSESLAVHRWVASSTLASPSPSLLRDCPAGELALSPPPSPSLQPQASSLASPGALSRRACLPAPARHHPGRRRLAIAAITTTQACSPSIPSYRQAGPALLGSPRPPLLAMCLEAYYTHTHTLALSLRSYSTLIRVCCPGIDPGLLSGRAAGMGGRARAVGTSGLCSKSCNVSE